MNKFPGQFSLRNRLVCLYYIDEDILNYTNLNVVCDNNNSNVFMLLVLTFKF